MPDEVKRLVHQARSTLARAKATLELARMDGASPPRAAFEAIDEALQLLDSISRSVSEARLASVRGAALAAPRMNASVLVVDDDLALAAVTCRQLERLGIDAAAAEELTVEVTRGYERAVVDLSVLVEADPEARRALARLRPIVVTGSDSDSDRRWAIAEGAVAYFVKPVDLPTLADALRMQPAES